MKKILVILITLGVLLAAVSVAQAQETVYIPIRWPGTYTFHADDDVYLAFGWGTCTPGLSQAFINGFSFSLTLDGDPLYQSVKHAPFFSPVLPDDFPFEGCLADPTYQNPSWVFWMYPLQYLAPGTYELDGVFSYDHKLVDGYDADQDGKPDFYEGERESHLTLVVLE